ncbi:hypothetical protein Ancab_011888 [Ancistrocladus abbreviatus]
MDTPEGIQAVMTAQDTLRGDLFGPRSEPMPRLGRDTFRDLEAHWLLPRGSSELNSNCRSSLSLVPWYPIGSQPSIYSPKSSHAAQGNGDAYMEECLADFLKRLRLEKRNSARKKKNKLPPQGICSPPSPETIAHGGREELKDGELIARSCNKSLMVVEVIWDFAELIGVKTQISTEEEVKRIVDMEAMDERAMIPEIAKDVNVTP